MNYRYMRIILFYDLPMNDKKSVRDYNHFVKKLIGEGFYRIQYSVFVKLAINQQSVDFTMSRVKEILPKEGNIFSFVLTEKQFASMEILLGETSTDLINDDSRVIEL